ncbi:hypothetical protein COS75_00845 [Candidatus Pacearchaeota archaeon CG06_land_8_20_14_3_00_35_12]|nr:MAG: hypothetical protein COS75_00845 [Candidatus Pacearchaeota archaeon CG06_land_8_20_14_3_00_35_12]
MIISKTAIGMGNGAAVYVPKEYEGKEVLVILPEGIEDLKKRVLSKLIQFMPNVLGVYLYGSYARGEEKQNSDIDILIIVQEKDIRIKELFDDVDVRVLTLKEIRKGIENFPVVTLPILKESKVFLNPLLLEELRNSKINFDKFKWHFQDIKRIIKIVKTFVEMDEEDISPDNIYSLMMRIRICNMMESLVKNEIFSNKSVKKVLLNYGLTEDEYEKFYSIYQQIRDNKDAKIKINKEEIFKLIKILADYYTKLEKEVKSKA